jgi:hypothetical protein
MTLASLALLATTPADACGGFFCDAGQPVLQAAERIVFGVDRDAGTVEMHVQITYSGPSEDFSWIVPVPKVPEIGITTSALFTQLAITTQPTFALNRVDEGHCREGGGGILTSRDQAFAAPEAGDASSGDNDGVTVIAEEAVGPYLTVTLAAETTDALIGWLDENGYDIPSALEPVLTPYVAKDAYFVALKLQKGNDVGDLAPLMLTFDAEKAMVPVQLTSVAATDDMRMEAYVLSDGRGVPTSYLHVKINLASIDWWTAGSNYNDVITQAADEAGGHAFATDSYGSTEIMRGLLFDPARFDEAALRNADDSNEWLSLLPQVLVTNSTELFEVVEDHVRTVGEGNGPTTWFCPTCFEIDPGFDAGAATDDLIARVAEPMEHAQQLVDAHPKLARMTSSLDAIEMTVDPVFAINDVMADSSVPLAHASDLVYECGNGKLRSKAPRRLELEDGRVIDLPSDDWIAKNETTDFEFIQDLGDTKAQVIEQMSEDGQPVVLFDYTDDLRAMDDSHNAFVRSLLGCAGCNAYSLTGTTPWMPSGALLAIGLLAARRRRA